MPFMGLVTWIVGSVIGVATYIGLSTTLGRPVASVLIFGFIGIWFFWGLLTMKRCDGCGELIKPWQGSGKLEVNAKVIYLHGGCSFTA